MLAKTNYTNLSLNIITKHLIWYPSCTNINYLWNLGFISGIFLVIQLGSGIFLAMHYTAHVDFAYASIEHIMRDVNYGWLLRYLHANGASFFFLAVYLHLARGLFFSSYSSSRAPLWISGILIFILMMAIAFLGYILPWGQMSFWGATVITNLFSAIPFIGNDLAFWLWGGYSVDNATLLRFFSLHYLLPFILLGMVIVHLFLLHIKGSTNPCGTEISPDVITFYPYFYYKDIVGILVFVVSYLFFVFYYPNALGHTDNYIPANPLITPAHIVPEWYFLPFYAILRAIPDKLGGVVAMGGALFVLLCLPLLTTSFVRTSRFRKVHTLFYFLFIFNFLLLGWLGGQPVTSLFIFLGRISTIYYFSYLIFFLPVLHLFEKFLILNYFSFNLRQIFYENINRILPFVYVIYGIYMSFMLIAIFGFIPKLDKISGSIVKQYLYNILIQLYRLVIYYFPLFFFGFFFLKIVYIIFMYNRISWDFAVPNFNPNEIFSAPEYEITRENAKKLETALLTQKLAKRSGLYLVGEGSPIFSNFFYVFLILVPVLVLSAFSRFATIITTFFYRSWTSACLVMESKNNLRAIDIFLGFLAMNPYRLNINTEGLESKAPVDKIEVEMFQKRTFLFFLTFVLGLIFFSAFCFLEDVPGDLFKLSFYIISKNYVFFDCFLSRLVLFLFTALFFFYFLLFYSILIEDPKVRLKDIILIFITYLIGILLLQLSMIYGILLLIEILVYVISALYIRSNYTSRAFLAYIIMSSMLLLFFFVCFGLLHLSGANIETFLDLSLFLKQKAINHTKSSVWLTFGMFLFFLFFKLGALWFSTTYERIAQNSFGWFFCVFNILAKFPLIFVLHFFCTIGIMYMPHFREFLFVCSLVSLIFGLLGAATKLHHITIYNLYSSNIIIGFILLFIAVCDSAVSGFTIYLLYFIYALQTIIFFAIKSKLEIWLAHTSKSNIIRSIQAFPLLHLFLMRYPKLTFVTFCSFFGTSGFPFFLGFYLKIFAIEHIVLNFGFLGNFFFSLYIVIYTLISYFYYTKILHGLFFERLSFIYTFQITTEDTNDLENTAPESLNKYFGVMSCIFFIFFIIIVPTIVVFATSALKDPIFLHFFDLQYLLKHYNQELQGYLVVIPNDRSEILLPNSIERCYYTKKSK